jgi:4a-hydroxytetrahydrobiopterin dehydratase
MMSELAKKECVPCTGGVRPMPADEAQRMLSQIGDGWDVVDNHHLSRRYEFPDFAKALPFVNRAGAIARPDPGDRLLVVVTAYPVNRP